MNSTAGVGEIPWAAPESGAVRDAPRAAASDVVAGELSAHAGVAVARGDARWPSDADELGAGRPNPLADLEPVGVGGVLDGGFDLLRFGFAPMVGLAASLLLPLQLIDLVLVLRAERFGDEVGGPSGLAMLEVLGSNPSPLSWVILVLRVVVLSLLGVLAGVMVRDLLAGRPRRASAVLAEAGGRWWVALLIALLTIPMKLASGCLFWIGFFAMDAFLMCSSVVAGAEGGGPLRSIARSWHLARGRYGVALGVSFGAFVISVILQVALYIGPVALVAMFATSEAVLTIVQQATALVLLITQPLTACIAARAYVELRCHGEALDLQRRRMAQGLTP